MSLEVIQSEVMYLCSGETGWGGWSSCVSHEKHNKMSRIGRKRRTFTLLQMFTAKLTLDLVYDNFMILSGLKLD